MMRTDDSTSEIFFNRKKIVCTNNFERLSVLLINSEYSLLAFRCFYMAYYKPRNPNFYEFLLFSSIGRFEIDLILNKRPVIFLIIIPIFPHYSYFTYFHFYHAATIFVVVARAGGLTFRLDLR